MKAILIITMFLITALSNAQQRIDLYGNKASYQKVNLSKVAKEVVYVPLETTNDCLLYTSDAADEL